MVLELIKKELKDKYIDRKNTLSYFRFALKAILYIFLMVLEWFIFSSLDKKINNFSFSSSFDFLVMFLFIMMTISIISSSLRARKSLFSRKDNFILSRLPIRKRELICSKMIYLYIKEVIILFILSSPLLFAFGINRNLGFIYYLSIFIYPLIISIFSVSISLIIVVIVEYIYRLIKTSSLIQFVLTSLLMIGLCFLYQFVLNMFLTSLTNSSFEGIFKEEFINNIHNISRMFIPTYNLLEIFILNKYILENIVIIVFVILSTLIISILITSLIYIKNYHALINVDFIRNKDKKLTLSSPFIALLKKEFNLLFKEGGMVISYTSLLIMSPFLSYVVISSIGLIIDNNLNYLNIYFPEMINGLNLTFILLFVGVINSSAALSISREEKTIQILKYIPVNPLIQIKAKIITPIILSSLSLLLTLIVLISTNSISLFTLIVAFIIGEIIIISSNLLGINLDMLEKRKNKISIRFLNAFLAIAFPILIMVIHFILSISKIEVLYIYMIEIILSLILLFISTFKIKNRLIRSFDLMEVN